MTTTTTPSTNHCESCGRTAQVTIAYPDTTFTLCVRCVPAELLLEVAVLPGAEYLEVQLELLLEQRQHLTLSATAT